MVFTTLFFISVLTCIGLYGIINLQVGILRVERGLIDMTVTDRVDRMAFESKISELASLIESETRQRFIDRGFTNIDTGHYVPSIKTTVKKGTRYYKVDVGTSGRYMVDTVDGTIYGIKAYGQVHKGHSYGTLDTIHDYYWGEYRAFRIDKDDDYDMNEVNM